MPRPVLKPTQPGVVGQQRQQTPIASSSQQAELTPRTAKLRGLAPLPQKFFQPLPGSDEDGESSSEYDAAQNMSSSTEGSDQEEDLNCLDAAQLKSTLDSEVSNTISWIRVLLIPYSVFRSDVLAEPAKEEIPSEALGVPQTTIQR